MSGLDVNIDNPAFVKVAAEAIERQFPELWAKCYPRRYEEPGKTAYDSPKAVARAMMDAVLNYQIAMSAKKPGTRVGQTEQNEALWASLMARWTVPTYYLSYDLATALNNTTPTDVLNWHDMKLPFPAAAFMLPKGILTHSEYGPVSFVAYARAFTNESVCFPHTNPAVKHDLHSMHDMFSIYLRTAQGQTLHWTFSEDMHLIDLKDTEELEELQRNYSHPSTIFPMQDFTPADIAAMMRAIKLVFNTVLLMTHKPELVEKAQLLKRVKCKMSGQPIEYWKPHVIGRTYKLRHEKHEALGGHHASPRGHWVSGFWREQPYGPRIENRRKMLWIEPYFRGGNLEG